MPSPVDLLSRLIRKSLTRRQLLLGGLRLTLAGLIAAPVARVTTSGGGQPRGWPFQLHLHAHSSHARAEVANQPGKLPAMSWQSWEGKRSGVDNLWWSEHDHAYFQAKTWLRQQYHLDQGQTVTLYPDTRSSDLGNWSSPPISAEPLLRVQWSGPGELEVRVYLSWHKDREGNDRRDIHTFRIPRGATATDLKKELRRAGIGQDNVLEKMRFAAREGTLDLTQVKVICQKSEPRELWQATAAIAQANAQRLGTQEFVSVEYSAEGSRLHHNAYLPSDDFLLVEEHASSRALARRVHERGGLFALNHPLGVKPGGGESRIRGPAAAKARELITANAHDADIIEAGYLQGRGGNSGQDHLDLWDLLVANRKFMKNERVILGVGVSDSHGAGSHGGPHCTWLISDSRPSRSEAVELMRQSQLFFGDYTIVPVDYVFDFEIDEAGNVVTEIAPPFEAADVVLVEVPTFTGVANYDIKTIQRGPLPLAVPPTSTSLYRLELHRSGFCIASTNHRAVGNRNP